MTDQPTNAGQPADYRKLAADLFNLTWTLLDKKDRTPAEDDKMIHAAHASRYFWGEVGTAVNWARGDWQMSRVYSVLGRPGPALYYAQSSLKVCQENHIGDFDLAFAYEALARASAVAGQADERTRYINLAREAGNHIVETDDQALLFADLMTIPSVPPK